MPPGGFTFYQPQTGWNAPEWRSFDVVVESLIEHRNANPFITKQHNLSTIREVVEIEVDEYNAQRCLNNGWHHFLSDAGPPGKWMPQRLSRGVAAAVGSVKRAAAGIGVVRDWLGDGLRPVDSTLASKRAEVCVNCPQNQDPNWIQNLEEVVAKDIRTKIEIKNDLKLSTPYDAQLLSCQVCDCPMSLKVWTPIEHIKNNTSSQVMSALSAVKTKTGKQCWVVTESKP